MATELTMPPNTIPTADSCSCFTPTAVHCIRLLQRQRVPQGALFTTLGINGAMATALTHVLSTLSYVEQQVEKSSDLKSVQFQVTAKIGASTTSETVIHLRNAVFDAPKEHLEVCDAEVKGDQDHNDCTPDRPGRQESCVISNPSDVFLKNIDRIPPNTGEKESPLRKKLCTERFRAPLENGMSRPPHRSNTGLNNATTFSISRSSCESIFRLLLDGTGIGTHCDPDMEFTMDSFSRPTIQELVRKVYTEEKRQRQANVNLTYRDLLPKEIQAMSRARFPILNHSFSRGIEPTKKHADVDLRELKTYGRIKKLTAIAALCLMLQTQGNRGSCHAVLSRFAKEGMNEEGCKVLFSSLSKVMLFMSSPCTEKSCNTITQARTKLLRTSFSEEKCESFIEVGTATIYPSMRRLHGIQLSQDQVAVRIGECKEAKFTYSAGTAFPVPCQQYPQTGLEGLGDLYSGQFLVWKTNLLSRVEVLGDLNRVIGTAIFARPMHQYAGFSGEQIRAKNVMDPAGAILIFDFKMNLVAAENVQLANKEHYIYKEWYQLQAFQRFKTSHFKNGNPPSQLIHIVQAPCLALLWNKVKVRPIETK